MEYKVTTEQHRGSATIFKNPILESLTRTNPTQNILVYGTVIGLLVYHATEVVHISWYAFLLLFAVGLFAWTLAEYLLHRFLFHWVSERKIVKRLHFIMHGSHHLYPRDEQRLLMPPVPGLLMAGILFAFFYFAFSLMGRPELTWAFFPGFFVGYLLYSFLHRATHVSKPPKRFKFLWKHHSLHHYKFPDKAFGVSNTLWDHVFGTMPPKNHSE